MARLKLPENKLMRGRIEKALHKLYRFSDGRVMTLLAYIENTDGHKEKADGTIDYNRRHFNSLDDKQQKEYMATLEGRTYYYFNNIKIPKMVWDCIL